MYNGTNKEKLFWAHKRAVRLGLWSEAKRLYKLIGQLSPCRVIPSVSWLYKVVGSPRGICRLVSYVDS